MKIYFAGPLFTTAERDFNAAVVALLRSRIYGEHEVFLPQEQESDVISDTIFKSDVDGIDWCEVIVANMDGADPDSGTCFEVGEAWRTKLTVLYRTDIREGAGTVWFMLHRAANTVINLQWKSVAEVADAIDIALRALYETGAIPKGMRTR